MGTWFTAWWKATRSVFAHVTGRRAITVAFISLLVIMGGMTLVAFAYDRAESDHILPGVKIGGVDVGGMTRWQAMRAVQRRANHRLSHRLLVNVGKRTFHVVPRKIGVQANVARAVRTALASTESMTWVNRSYHRLFGWSVDVNVPLTTRLPKGRVATFVQRVQHTVDEPAQNAAIVLSDDGMHAIAQHAAKGFEVDPHIAWNRVAAALRNARHEVRVPVDVTEPKRTDDELGKTLTVDVTTNEVHLYDGFHIVRTYPVATAQPGYSTPVGEWQVVDKVENPAWYNPCPDGGCWAASEPPMIPPGPSNPLGLRALYLSAPGIRIHGTPDSPSVGTYASHGCIRMYESDVIALYPLVPVKTPVVIYGAPPWGNSGTSGVPG